MGTEPSKKAMMDGLVNAVANTLQDVATALMAFVAVVGMAVVLVVGMVVALWMVGREK